MTDNEYREFKRGARDGFIIGCLLALVLLAMFIAIGCEYQNTDRVGYDGFTVSSIVGQ